MKERRFIPLCKPVFDGNETRYVTECIETTWVSSQGRFVSLFEEAFARFCGVPYAVATSSGTTALHLTLVALGVGPGDQVIVPSLTFVATANAVRYCGATPVFVDSEPRTWNLDPARLPPLLTKRVKGIIVVHLYGHPVDMEPVLEIARQHGLFVVEDAAQAHGAEYRGRRVGGLGDAGVFSFFGNKVITTGEGGMVTVRSPELFDKLRFLRNQGMDPHRRYWFPVIGYNYRITNLQAAVGVAQLERIDARLRERRRLAQWYQTHLAPLNDFLILPVEEAWARHTFWLYSVVLREATAAQRDSVLSLLEQEGIETRPIFYPMHLLPPYRTEHQPCPTAESIALRGLSLPTHSGVTEEDVLFIAQAFHRLRNRSTILSKHRSL